MLLHPAGEIQGVDIVELVTAGGRGVRMLPRPVAHEFTERTSGVFCTMVLVAIPDGLSRERPGSPLHVLVDAVLTRRIMLVGRVEYETKRQVGP